MNGGGVRRLSPAERRPIQANRSSRLLPHLHLRRPVLRLDDVERRVRGHLAEVDFLGRGDDPDVRAGAGEDGVDRLKTKAHIAYRVTGIEDWKSKLHQRGIEILDGLPIPGAERFEFRDPFGNRVEFIERIAARAKCDE